jgi:hypothetical protein
MSLWKRFVVGASCLFLLPLALSAQDIPKAELSLGYSLLRFSTDRVTTHGWNVAIAPNINKNLAIVFDFAGHYGNLDEVSFFGNSRWDVKSYSVMMGPRASQVVGGRWRPFAQFLVGYHRTTYDVDITSFGEPLVDVDTQSGVTATAGGGLDFLASDRFAIRLFQAEYAVHRFEDINFKGEGARIGVGIIFRLGRRTQ